MYSIIDIETTGVKPGKSKIIEIAIINHDGHRVVEKWSSLINPEGSISYFITKLTGITNEMVEDAPKFYEVAKKIVELTKGNVFVAHNVGFDYGFIKAEFADLGFEFNRKKLCTVRLGRKLIPGHKSYSLGKITADLGISLKNAHRAMGDTLATVELFQRYLEIDKSYIDSLVDEQRASSLPLPPHLPKEEVDSLPENGGVYYFHGKDGNILYIGKANNIKKRIFQHFATKPGRGKGLKLHNHLYHITYEKYDWELLTLIIENTEIKKYQPPLNRASTKTLYPFGIFYSETKGSLQARKTQGNEIPLLAFGTKTQAIRKLEDIGGKLNLEWVSVHELKVTKLHLKIIKTYWEYPSKNCLLVKKNRFIEIRDGKALRHGVLDEDGCQHSHSNIEENPEIRGLILRFWGNARVLTLGSTRQHDPHILGHSTI